MTDRHFWKVKVIDGMDGNGGGNGGILPRLVRLANQDSGNNETETDNATPENLCCLCLRKKSVRKGSFGCTLFPKENVRKVTRGDFFVKTSKCSLGLQMQNQPYLYFEQVVPNRGKGGGVALWEKF